MISCGAGRVQLVSVQAVAAGSSALTYGDGGIQRDVVDMGLIEVSVSLCLYVWIEK